MGDDDCDEIIFDFCGVMVEIDGNGVFQLSQENNIGTKFMAIPKEVFMDTERYITITNFSEMHRVLKMHIMIILIWLKNTKNIQVIMIMKMILSTLDIKLTKLMKHI